MLHPETLTEQEKALPSRPLVIREKLVRRLLLHRNNCKGNLPPRPPFSAGCFKLTATTFELLRDWYLGHVDILHDRPNNRQTTGFCREGVNLVRALSHVPKKTFNRIGRANRAMHHLWEGIKGEQMLFIFTETTDRFGIALLVFGECSQLN